MTAAPAMGREPGTPIDLCGETLLPDLDGAVWWPARRTLVVADLHLEKGSAWAGRGQLLPPYDTAATLRGLERALARHRPETVVALGDSFHDREAALRLSDAERNRLTALTGARRWIWVLGNHDPEPPGGLGGEAAEEVRLGGLTFRHEAWPLLPRAGEVSGHFHPKASVSVRGRRVSGRCFVEDGERLILPAFGTYTGGLSVLDPAIAGLFGKPLRAHILGRRRAYTYPKSALVG